MVIDLHGVFSKVRLIMDKFYANSQWFDKVSSWETQHISVVGSDHLALRLRFNSASGDKLLTNDLG